MNTIIKIFVTVLIFCFASTAACAFDLSEEMLNQYVQQRITEKPNRDIQILNQKISLLDGFATICATLHARAFARDVDFCADMTPTWRQETGSLLATKMALVSLSAPGVNAQHIEWVKILVNQVVLPGWEGVEIYRADNFIGKQFSWLKVLPGKVSMGF